MERALSETIIRETVAKPLLRLVQADGRILYLSEKAVAVLDDSGRVTTNYGRSNFEPEILNILKLLGK